MKWKELFPGIDIHVDDGGETDAVVLTTIGAYNDQIEYRWRTERGDQGIAFTLLRAKAAADEAIEARNERLPGVKRSNKTHRRADAIGGIAEPVSTEAQPLVTTHATVVVVQIDRAQEQLRLCLDLRLLAEQQRIRRENEELEKWR